MKRREGIIADGCRIQTAEDELALKVRTIFDVRLTSLGKMSVVIKAEVFGL